MAFENLERTQPKIADELRNNIKNNLLPQSLLFNGKRGSSRLTGALDLAFYLTGDDRNTLRTESVIYFPHRSLDARVKAAVNLFSSERTEKAKYFLLETLRLVNMQYNPVVVGESISQSMSSVFNEAGNLESFLKEIEDKSDITDKDVKTLNSFKILTNPKYLYWGKNSPTSVTIEELRSLKEWMMMGTNEKVVIIEDIEAATEGAKNSILKMLEEPEEHFTIILLSSEGQKILETILSRVRKFNFSPLSRESINALIKERFNQWEDYSSFDSFFFKKANDEESYKKCGEAIDYFVSLLTSQESFTLEKEEELNSTLDKLSAHSYFMERVMERIEKGLLKGEIAPYKARRIQDILAYWTESMDTYNLSTRSALDYIVREAKCVK